MGFIARKTTDCSSPLIARIRRYSSSIMRVISQEGDLKVSSSFNPLNPMSEVCAVFGLTFKFWEATKKEQRAKALGE